MHGAAIECPRSASEEELDNLLDLMVRSFPQAKSRDHFVNRYPHLYRRNAEEAKNHFVINAGGQCISHLGLFPATVAVGEDHLKAGCIGGVCTHPDFRNRGLAGTLLQYSIRRMKEQGFDLSILGGNRELYGKYGWELAGRKIIFSVTRSSLTAHGIKPSDSLNQYHGNRKDLELIMGIHDKEPVYFVRTRETFDLLLQKILLQSWFSPGAYVVGDQMNFIEGGGIAPDFVALVLRVMQENDLASIQIERPYWADDINRLLFKVSGDWKVENVISIRFIDLYRVLHVYLRRMAIVIPYRRGRKPEPITLEIADTQDKATLHFDDPVVATPEETPNKLSLSALEMVRLVFGDYCRLEINPCLQEPGFGALKCIFPLPFHLWGLDRF